MINLQHEAELIELFEAVTVDFPGKEGSPLRAITFEGFKLAIDKMMNKAYYYGNQQGLREAEAIVDQVFT